MSMNTYDLDPDKSKIKILPDHLIDQIKAGEVVERPSSALKELLENALDAKASDIKIHIIENGLELIQIEDNGQGMSYEELPFAFYRHATSKLKKFDDLFDLDSFGFRGEALASIASSAKVTCSSFPARPNSIGGQIELHGGHIAFYQKLSTPVEQGSKISVRELFYNTPARLKFLNSKSSEKTYVTKLIEAFMLSHPEVTFSLRFDQQDKKVYAACDFHTRLTELYLKKDVTKNIATLSQAYEGYKTTIHLIPEESLRPGKKRHFVFINNRYIQDPYFFQVCKRFLEQSSLDKNMSFILFIESPKMETDVNVHPNKTKIKIHQLSVITSLLHSLFQKLKPQAIEGKSPLPNPYSKDSVSLKSRDLSSAFRKYETQSSSNEHDLNLQNVNETPHFFFDSKKQRLVNFKLFLKHFLSQNFAQENTHLIPLLISEKINTSKISAQKINVLKELGFELEFEEKDKEIFLKTIPQFLEHFKSNSIALFISMIVDAEWNNQIEFLNYLNTIDEKTLNLTPTWNDHYFDLPSISTLDNTLFCKQLTQSDWKNIWQS